MGVVKKNNKVYLIGGNNDTELVKTVEVFDLENKTIKKLEGLPMGLSHMSIELYNDTIYIFGGRQKTGLGTKNEIYQYFPEDNISENTLAGE